MCLQRERTSNSQGIINCIKLRWIIITQYQVVSKLLQSNKSAIRLRFVSRSRKKQTNKHKSVVFLAASYRSQCPTGPNGPKVGQIYYIERLLFNDYIELLLLKIQYVWHQYCDWYHENVENNSNLNQVFQLHIIINIPFLIVDEMNVNLNVALERNLGVRRMVYKSFVCLWVYRVILYQNTVSVISFYLVE